MVKGILFASMGVAIAMGVGFVLGYDYNNRFGTTKKGLEDEVFQ